MTLPTNHKELLAIMDAVSTEHNEGRDVAAVITYADGRRILVDQERLRGELAKQDTSN